MEAVAAQQRSQNARRRADLRSSLPYIKVPPVQQQLSCDDNGARSPGAASVVSITLDAVEMPSRSPKKRSKRSESPMAQYALFPLPPVRPPLSASPLSARTPLGSTPRLPSPSPSAPNSTENSSEAIQYPNRSIPIDAGRRDYLQMDGLGISYVLDSYYRFGSATPTAMNAAPVPRQSTSKDSWSDDADDSCSLASTTDISIYAISTSSSSSVDFLEDTTLDRSRDTSTLSRPSSVLSRRSSPALCSSASTTAGTIRRRRRTSSRASTDSSPDSLLDFDMLVSVARRGEAEAAARQAEREEAAAARLAEEVERENHAWAAALKEDLEELQDEQESLNDAERHQWQHSTRSLASLRSQTSRPELRSRQSTATTIRPVPKRKIVFDEPSSSDEEYARSPSSLLQGLTLFDRAFDLSLDASLNETHTSPPSSTYTRSPASSFGFSRRESSATEASISAASSYSAHLAVPSSSTSLAEPLPSPKVYPGTSGHKKGLSSPPQLQQLKPLRLPARVAEYHKRQQSTIQPLPLQGRKASLPAISWAESPPRPERKSSLAAIGPRSLRPATSTPNLRSRLPTLGRVAAPSTTAPVEEDPSKIRSRLPSAPDQAFGSVISQLSRKASLSDRACGLSPRTAQYRQPASLPDRQEETTETLPLRHVNKLRSSRTRTPSSQLSTQGSPVPLAASGLPSLNKLRGFRSSPVLRASNGSKGSLRIPKSSEEVPATGSPRSSVLTAFVRSAGGGERRSMLPMRSSPRASSSSTGPTAGA